MNDHRRYERVNGKTSWVRGVVLVLPCVLCVLLSVEANQRLRDGLGYHGIDFGYYYESTVKLFNATYRNSCSLSPEGANLFKMKGYDVATSLWASIHFDPPRILMALLYRLHGSFVLVVVFHTLLFLSPLLVYRHPDGIVDKATVAFVLFSCFSFNMLTYDLRTFNLIAPMVLLIYSTLLVPVSERKTWWLFNVSFLVREELLVFNFCYIILRAYDNFQSGKRASEGLRRYVWSWGVWLVAIMSYFVWAGYGSFKNQRFLFALFAFLCMEILVRLDARSDPGAAGAERIRRILGRWAWAVPFVLMAPVLFLLVHYGIHHNMGYPWLLEDPAILLRDGRFSILPFLLVVLYNISCTRMSRPGLRVTRWVFLALVTLSILVSGQRFYGWKTTPDLSVEQARVVFEAKRNMDPFLAAVLTDESTHQAFVDFENVYNFRHLPIRLYEWRGVRGPYPAYPDNLEVLSGVLDRVDHIVVSRGSWAILRDLIEGRSFREEESNERFVVLRAE